MKSMKYVAAACILLAASVGSAAPVTTYIVDGQLAGFDGITLGSDEYNVRFIEGTWADLVGLDGSGLDFIDLATVTDANNALVAAYIANPIFNDDPALTVGITISTFTWIYTPFRASGGQIKIHSILNTADADARLFSVLNIGSYYDTTDIAGEVYADWQKVSAVPIPAAAWLFGSGLLGLIGIARRKKV